MGATSHTVVYDTTFSPISIDTPIAGNDIIDVSEDNNVLITGTSEPNVIVTVEVRDSANNVLTQNIPATPAGGWTSTFDVSSLNEGLLTITASETIVGNTLSASHDVIYQVILGAVSVDSPITSDNIINSVEQNNLFISGTSDISNTVTVAVSDGTSTVSSVVTVTSNTWSAILDVSSLVDGPVIVSVTGVDALSSVYTDATSATLQTTLPSLSVDEPLFDDNVINDNESTGDIISGTGTPGDVITVTLTDGDNVVTETVTVGGDGTWEVTVNTETLDDGPITVTTSVTDDVGNVSTTVTIIEQNTSGPTSTINTPVSGDDIVNAVEDNSLTLNGESEPDSMVTVTLTDENGDTVTVMATDEFGNEGLPSTHTIEHTTNGPVVSINTPIEGDNIINAMEEETTDISGVGTP